MVIDVLLSLLCLSRCTDTGGENDNPSALVEPPRISYYATSVVLNSSFAFLWDMKVATVGSDTVPRIAAEKKRDARLWRSVPLRMPSVPLLLGVVPKIDGRRCTFSLRASTLAILLAQYPFGSSSLRLLFCRGRLSVYTCLINDQRRYTAIQLIVLTLAMR